MFTLIGLALLVSRSERPQTKNLKIVPSEVASLVPLYDPDNIDTITLTSRAHWSPALTYAMRFGAIRQLFGNPIRADRDAVTITWTRLSAQPIFIRDYYQSALNKKSFTVGVGLPGEVIFTNPKFSGKITIEDDPNKSGTDRVTMTLSFIVSS